MDKFFFSLVTKCARCRASFVIESRRDGEPPDNPIVVMTAINQRAFTWLNGHECEPLAATITTDIDTPGSIAPSPKHT
jgi:hypothetical protein